MDTQNDGLEMVTPALNMAMFGIYPSSSSSLYIWNQARCSIYQVTIDPWFQICRELEDFRGK